MHVACTTPRHVKPLVKACSTPRNRFVRGEEVLAFSKIKMFTTQLGDASSRMSRRAQPGCHASSSIAFVASHACACSQVVSCRRPRSQTPGSDESLPPDGRCSATGLISARDHDSRSRRKKSRSPQIARVYIRRKSVLNGTVPSHQRSPTQLPSS